jgi:hypothetical protein
MSVEIFTLDGNKKIALLDLAGVGRNIPDTLLKVAAPKLPTGRFDNIQNGEHGYT